MKPIRVVFLVYPNVTQLDDPSPPFDSGTPEKAGEELVEQVHARSNRMAPDREQKILAAADRLNSTA